MIFEREEKQITMKTQSIEKFLVAACCMLLAVFVFAGGAPAKAAKATGDTSDKAAASSSPRIEMPNRTLKQEIRNSKLSELSPKVRKST